jgi:hypothetical protein
VVKTGRSEVKPLISPCSELGLSSRSEEGGWEKKYKNKADAERLYCAGFYSEDHNREE